MTEFDKAPFILYHAEFNDKNAKNTKKQVWKICRDKVDHHMEVRKFKDSQCLEFALDKNIRCFTEVAAVTGWNGPEIFVEYGTSPSDNKLFVWDATVAVKYANVAVQTPENFSKAQSEFVCKTINCPNMRDVMWRHFHRGTFKRANGIPPEYMSNGSKR